MLIQKWDTQTKIPTVKIFVWEKPKETEINNSTWNLRAIQRFHNANIYKAQWSECVVWCGARTRFTENQGIAPHEIKWTTNSIRSLFFVHNIYIWQSIRFPVSTFEMCLYFTSLPPNKMCAIIRSSELFSKIKFTHFMDLSMDYGAVIFKFIRLINSNLKYRDGNITLIQRNKVKQNKHFVFVV